MKALEWQRFFLEQRNRHRKNLFSVGELANVAQTTLHALNTELSRLVERGILCRYAQGLYGMPEAVSAEELVHSIDPGAYVTGFFALFRHRLVTQVPTQVTCFSNRRHNRRRDRVTPAGRLRFVRVPPRIYFKPRSGILASPEQALCDFAWLNLSDGVDPGSLVTLRNLHSLEPRKLHRVLLRYPANVSAVVAALASAAAPAQLVRAPRPFRSHTSTRGACHV